MTSTPVEMTGGARRYCSMKISAWVLRYVSVASAVGAPAEGRLRMLAIICCQRHCGGNFVV